MNKELIKEDILQQLEKIIDPDLRESFYHVLAYYSLTENEENNGQID